MKRSSKDKLMLLLALSCVAGFALRVRHSERSVLASGPASPAGYIAELTIPAPPTVGQSTTVQLAVEALNDAHSGSNEVVISLPKYFTISGGTPSGYTVQSGYPPSLSRFNDVIWQASLTASQPQTFSLTVIPTQSTTHALHDEVSGRVHPARSGLYDGPGDTLFIRVGNEGQPGTVAEAWPDALAVLSEGFMPGNPDGSNAVAFDDHGNEIPLDTATVEELPETKPLSVGIYYDPIVAAGIPVGLRVVIHNTILSTVSFTGTLTLPEDWLLVTGQAGINAALPPGQTMVLAYQVVPQTIRCEWTTSVYLRVDNATIAQCHDDVRLKQRGGMYPCGGQDDWLLLGQPPGVRKAYTADTERIPVRPKGPRHNKLTDFGHGATMRTCGRKLPSEGSRTGTRYSRR